MAPRSKTDIFALALLLPALAHAQLAVPSQPQPTPKPTPRPSLLQHLQNPQNPQNQNQNPRNQSPQNQPPQNQPPQNQPPQNQPPQNQPPQNGMFGIPVNSGGNTPPPREVPLVEARFEALSNQEISDDGKKALAINPAKWKHAETQNFVLHYRRATEAQKVVREVEYDLWYVAGVLGATRERYTKKSHIYVFEDADEWKEYLQASDNPMKWAASYARGDELFLNVRGGGNSGPNASFDSKTLAHETTHAVVARLYPGQRFPLWLNEGFAEYMAGASIAARKGQAVKRFQGRIESVMPLRTLEALTQYPSDETGIHQLYQTSEKFVRFLMSEFPKERITRFIDLSLQGKGMQESFLAVYSDHCKDWPTFEKRFERFSK